MNNLESHNRVGTEKILHGREAIPVKEALAEQKELVLWMTPEEIKPYLPEDKNDEYNPILEALMMRYLEKYVMGDFNGFAEFCNEHDSDLEFMERAKNGKLTAADFQKMSEFIQEKSRFFTAEEVASFLAEHVPKNKLN